MSGCTAQYNDAGTQTNTALFTDRGMHHTEGGWPKEINLNELSQVNRFLRKIEKDEFFASEVYELATEMETRVMENIAINIFDEYFDYEDDVTVEKEDQMKTKCVFQDPIKV